MARHNQLGLVKESMIVLNFKASDIQEFLCILDIAFKNRLFLDILIGPIDTKEKEKITYSPSWYRDNTNNLSVLLKKFFEEEIKAPHLNPFENIPNEEMNVFISYDGRGAAFDVIRNTKILQYPIGIVIMGALIKEKMRSNDRDLLYKILDTVGNYIVPYFITEDAKTSYEAFLREKRP
jgi:hypothetical protein